MSAQRREPREITVRLELYDENRQHQLRKDRQHPGPLHPPLRHRAHSWLPSLVLEQHADFRRPTTGLAPRTSLRLLPLSGPQQSLTRLTDELPRHHDAA